MPVMYNFGHVAVSGCCFWKTYPSKALSFMVTHFNTQRLVRMDLTPDGSTYKAVENEFLKFHDSPDIHLTDVMEDPRDGSLLLLDTGGWFRIGCPSSLMAKSDLLGAIYRIRPEKPRQAKPLAAKPAVVTSAKAIIAMLKSENPFTQRSACDILAQEPSDSPEFSGYELHQALLGLMSSELDPVTEHAAIHAYFRRGYDLSTAQKTPLLMRRVLKAESNHRGGYDKGPDFHATTVAFIYLDDADEGLAATALEVFSSDPNACKYIPKLLDWLADTQIKPARIRVLKRLGSAFLSIEHGKALVTEMLNHDSESVRLAALEVLAFQAAGVTNEAWFKPLESLLAKPTQLLLDAIKKLKTPHFDAQLQAIANDAKQPLSIRLKALDAAKSVKLEGETFAMVKNVLTDAGSGAAAKIQAAEMIAHAPLPKERAAEIASLFATVGPVELKTLLPLLKRHKDAEITRAFAREIAKNPVIASQQESLYRTALADLPTDIFETIILPAYNAAVAVSEAKKRQLGPLAEKVIASGKATRGEAHFKAGKGTCIACHKVGETGRAIGPDLSKIGAIRTERDLLESILFPSNTLARDYEAHVIETRDGVQTLGVIKSHTAEGLLVVDVAGQEKNVPHADITGDVTLTTSLMPAGLDQTLPESELLDLVAWLRSLK
jgi:putative heme-binding domain-containing protein